MSHPTPDYWDDAKAYLSKKDKTLKKLIDTYHGEAMQLKGDYFQTLARSIVGQQISVKAADSVWARVCTQVGAITPKNVLAASEPELRSCGLSGRKVEYMHSIARFFIEREDDIAQWDEVDDATIIKQLTEIKGIGVWTAEMFLLFALGRPDIFPLLDIGMLKAIYLHYNDGEKMGKADVIALGAKWQPYRTVATWYLWRALDPVPVAY